MAKLKAKEASMLANIFLGLAQAIGDFRYENWQSLTKSENQTLGNLQHSIMSFGESILAMSTSLVMEEAQASIDALTQVTNEIKSTVKKLENAQKGIDLGAAVVSLGAAIVSKDPKSISGRIGDLIDVWKG